MKTTPLFFQRRFLPMWTALSLGAFSDNMLKQALSIALVYGVISAPLIGNDNALPIVGSLFPIAMLLFSSISGQLADKFETSFMFRRTKLAEFYLMVFAAIGFFTGSSVILILALFLMGAQSAFFSPARTGAMPKYLRANELVRGNAFCGGGLFVSILLGIVLGGLLIVTSNGAFLVSGILVIAALGGWLAARMAPEAAANAPDLKIDWNGFAQAREIFSHALSARGVFRPVLGVGAYWSIGACVTVTVPLFARDSLAGDASVTTAFMGLFAIGAALGTTAASLLPRKRTGLGLSAYGISASGILIILIVLACRDYQFPTDGALQNAAAFFSSPLGLPLAILFILASFSMSIFVVPLQAAVQRRATPEKRSRILAANNMVNAAGAMIGSWLVLFVTTTSITPLDILLWIAGAEIAIGVYMWRRNRKLPAGLFDEMLHPPGQHLKK